ncbi:BTAD domain-containing putative transcriptional regulator [Cohnella rhizosphaerae]|uniref:Winged helix-turn-helix domain-containing protein n=1 Tax=Cohnella rhizosphaerae TaxID=1457232 RepID=A0A9X4KUT2_9BACL|nr:BTAD domain-containing putative transcriptional regulator [Cohnella rhizosphaerae]MDG0811292.1 winged helix-turn-helix domain-containing protein [Cohnella rhizosphaerae]
MIVQTKLYIPQVRSALVSRPRLIRKLDGGLSAKLTLVAASAGYGKTTALSEWARQSGIPVAWVSLDKQDDAWIPFWSCVAASIQAVVPGFAEAVGPLLNEGPSATSASPDPAVSAMLNELHRHPGELAIVLDDYHLIEHADIQKSLSYWLERLPPRVHLYIASRTELAIPTARLLARGEMRRITAQDLRFDPQEGLSFFRDTTDLPLSGEQVEALYDQTEGWISGLQLAALTLKSSGDIAGTIRQFGGQQHRISDYLFQEVFRDLPEALRAFLLRTSILSRMNDSLCRAVTGMPDCQPYLEQLEQSNLFTIPLDDDRHWYRYHHLMSDFLQRQLARTAPELETQAHIQAAQWLASRGFEEEAAEHYLAGRQYDDVVFLIEKNLLELLHKKAEKVSGWVLQLPESALAKRPMAEMLYLSLLIGTRQWEAALDKIEQAKIRYEAMRERMDEAEWKRLMGNIYFLCAAAGYFQKDLERVSMYFRLAEQVAPEGSLFASMGDNKYYGYDEFDDPMSYINDYRAAASFLGEWLQRLENGMSHPSAAILHATCSGVWYEWNRLEEAEAMLDRALKAQVGKINPRSLLQIYFYASRIQQALGRSTCANELLEELKLRIESPDYERFLRKIEAEQASLAVRQGNWEAASAWLERCGMNAADDVSLNGAAEQMTFAFVLGACGRHEEALSLAERLQRLFWKEDRLRNRIRMAILQSVTLHRAGRAEASLRMLELALRLAQPEGFIRSFADEGAVMAEMLTAYVERYAPSHSGPAPSEPLVYAKGLLRALTIPQAQTQRPERIEVRCFGHFRTYSGRAGANQLQWRTSKTMELMAYLVHHRGEAIDKYQIVEALWSHVDAKRAIAQLNTTVHYLRKQLLAIGYDGMVHYAKGQYRLDMNRLDCDYDRWRQLLSAGVPAAIERVKAYEQSLGDFYRTGYLADSAYAWAEQARGRLEEEYVGMLLQIHDVYVHERDFPAAIAVLKRALACDPFNESLHTKLIRVYMLAEDRVAAKKQYDFLHSLLRAEFGIEPSEAAKQWLKV